jgi:hypothetical protein
MSLSPEQQRTLDELASLPPDHPRRQAFVATLPQADETTRAEWSILAREGDRLRTLLQRIDPPAALHATLLALPDHAPPARAPSWKSLRISWPLVAAVLLVVMGIGSYTYWRESQPADYAHLPAAPQAAVDAITLAAVNTHRSTRPLDMLSDDRQAVRAALQAKIGKAMPFPVIIPDPGANFHLLGGSICPFGTTQAVETRWESKGHIYTLLQFAPDDLGMPHRFTTSRQSPPTQQLAMADVSVTIWPAPPEGICTWAVVRDRKAPPDPFAMTIY